MSVYPEIKKYSMFFDNFRHHFKFGVSWHEITEEKDLMVYSIVAYTIGMGFGKKLVEEIENFAFESNCITISFQDVINIRLTKILIKKGYLIDIEYIDDFESQIHYWKTI